MSCLRMLFCDVCDRKITVDADEEFNYSEKGEGPFCEVCWFFVLRIEALRDRVKGLEEDNRAVVDFRLGGFR